LYTDVILLVIDINDSITDLKKKFRSCKKALSELGVSPDKIILALNKSDLVDKKEIKRKIKYLNLDEDKKWIPVSAIDGYNLEQLMQLIKNLIKTQHEPNVKKSLKEELERIYGN